MNVLELLNINTKNDGMTRSVYKKNKKVNLAIMRHVQL